LLEVCENTLLQAAAWYWLAETTSEIAQTSTHIARCIALARAASETTGVDNEFSAMTDRNSMLASALGVYAQNLIDQGEVARAVPIARESLGLFQIRANPHGIGMGLGTLGRLALLQGDLAQAHRLFHEVMTIANSFNLRPTQCEWQPLLGIVTLYGGDVPEARRLLSESWRLCLELKNKFFLARVCTYLAELALWEGEIEQAAHWLAQSLDHLADPHRITMFQITRLFVAARVATAQQLYLRAAPLFGVADQMHSHIQYAIGGPMRDLADAALAMARAALDPLVFVEAFAMGQQMSLEEAFAEGLGASPIPSDALQ
jgi:hypothetical protein